MTPHPRPSAEQTRIARARRNVRTIEVLEPVLVWEFRIVAVIALVAALRAHDPGYARGAVGIALIGLAISILWPLATRSPQWQAIVARATSESAPTAALGAGERATAEAVR